jgi:alpha/beta superfamily hydrolase
MQEKRVIFPSGPLRLEGYFAPAVSGRGVVVAHPHPLMGGSLDNLVVETVVTAFAGQGYATLRFNFRGVGLSEGAYDEGRGEQEDLRAAVDFLAGRGVREILLAGYSFGAWVIVRLLGQAPPVRGALLVSPPIRLMDFDFSGLDGKILLIVAGDRDPYCDAKRLQEMAAPISAPVRLLARCDHFYSGSEEVLSDTLTAFLM